MSRRLIRRVWWRIVAPCTHRACRRCRRAGRTSYGVRYEWHEGRRDCRWSLAAAALVASPFVAIVAAMALIGELTQ